MSTHNICFCGELRKCQYLLTEKLPHLEQRSCCDKVLFVTDHKVYIPW